MGEWRQVEIQDERQVETSRDPGWVSGDKFKIQDGRLVETSQDPGWASGGDGSRSRIDSRNMV